MRQAKSKPGYLLIELLAALTLAAIAITALLPSIASRSDAALHTELVQQAIDLDRRARSASLRAGPVVMRQTDGQGLTLANRTGDQIGSAGSPKGQIYLLGVTDSPIVQIRFDVLGRSPSYRLAVQSHGRTTLVTFDGLSGIALAESSGERLP